jgi:hypothetical protein
MRADESKTQREIQASKIRELILSYKVGSFIDGSDWYQTMQDMGLVHSARQRLSDLREEGLVMNWDRKRHGFIYEGFQETGQLVLFV